MFIRLDMARVASASTGAQANWMYRTTDSFSDVIAPNYFNDAFTGLRVDDVIQVKYLDGYKFISITQSDNNAVVVKTIDFSSQLPEVLLGFSFDNQDPITTDTPIKIELGGTIGDSNDQVSMVDNVIHINQEGTYLFRMIFSVTRPSSVGIAFIFIRGLVNGVQLGNPVAVSLSDDDMTIPLEYTFSSFLPAGTTLSMEMYRDSAGTDSGGLTSLPSLIGWGNAPSASIRITRLS